MTRVEVAYANLGNALAEWKLSDTDKHSCILVFGETEEWLLGCPEMAGKSGFVANGESWRGKPILWNGKSYALSDHFTPYAQIKDKLVGTVTSYKSDSGEERPVFVVQEWDALHKNHPGFQQANLEEWLGVFVHEAFHGHQLYHPRVRALLGAMNTEKGLTTKEELAAFYKQNEGFKEAVQREYALVREAANDPALDASRARETLRGWLEFYRTRRATYDAALEQTIPGKKAASMDEFYTFLEGGARFVEAKFLIAPTESSFVQLRGEPTFKDFSESKGKKPSELVGLGNKLESRYFYGLGMYLCFLLDVADPSWKTTLFSSDELLIGQVQRTVSAP